MKKFNRQKKDKSPLGYYLSGFPKNRHLDIRQKIANELGVSEVYVRSMCNGNKKIPKEYAVLIHKLTDGAVPFYVIDPTLAQKMTEMIKLMGAQAGCDETITAKN